MNVIHKIGVILFLLCPYISLYGQEGKDTLTFRIVSYNVENLFDTLDDEQNESDNEYLPDGRYNWTPERYLKKLNNLSKVITAIVGGKSAPTLIGLAEVENDKVLDDLIKRTTIDNEYSFVHYESPDERGIDVALL